MLEKVDLSLTLDKAEYQALTSGLQRRLTDLQKACWRAEIPTIIVFEGWDASGKGSSVQLLTRRLDPRGFTLYAIQAPRPHEQHVPWLWRFWQRIPAYGEIAIFDRSWYGRVLVERVEEFTPENLWRRAYRDIVNFERLLADDGFTIIKFFLHISKAEQARRFRQIEADPLTSWYVQPEDWEHHAKYNAYVTAIEEMLERTDTEWGPWTIVEATDRRWTRFRILSTLVARLEAALRARGLPVPESILLPEAAPDVTPDIAADAPATPEPLAAPEPGAAAAELPPEPPLAAPETGATEVRDAE
ncbi:MAG: Polyphosphate kinase 2 (PPK2) [Chloroflexi bacterium ADurb.Bin222]|nr:MAG: Polyphosphate kinase 2 (PPK2) [Chloroflexi bacterium ADurb.Bin222]